MLRSWLILISALLGLGLPGVGRAAVDVFQDPANVGNPAAPTAVITVGGPAVALNLFYRTGTVPSPSNACLSGTGEEVCGWDIHVSTTNPSVVLQSFTPDAGPGSDIVAAITGNVLRANGGIPTTGELGTHRIGTLLVSATAAGSVVVAGNLYVTAALAAAPVTAGNTLATASTGGLDTDGDTVPDATDNCPVTANTNQADGDADAVGDVCDNCTTRANARVAAGFLTTNTWATLTGGQRDDDHDGFGNRCDADFTPTGTLVGPADLSQFRASNGKNRTGDTCGASPLSTTQPCAIYDLDEAGLLIGPGDLTQFRALSGKVPGPKCATCPLTCTAGTTGSCL
jgi:hypothetical protein